MDFAVPDVISASGLRKHYQLGANRVDVLRDVNLTVRKGEYVAIMGQSGAGKSTLLNILGCLDAPSQGSYRLNGHDVPGLDASGLCRLRSYGIGFIFQNFNLLPRMTVAANVELPLIYQNVRKAERRARVAEALRGLGIFERRNHLPAEISGGEKQRAAIARALVKRPALILADEPTGNLDSATTREILSILDRLHAEGNTLLIITHDDQVAARADRIVGILDGVLRD
jgi:putative ABC transport system ATP-binding protein